MIATFSALHHSSAPTAPAPVVQAGQLHHLFQLRIFRTRAPMFEVTAFSACPRAAVWVSCKVFGNVRSGNEATTAWCCTVNALGGGEFRCGSMIRVGLGLREVLTD